MTCFHAFELWMLSGFPLWKSHATCNEYCVHSGTNTCSPRDSTMPILTAATPRMPRKMQHDFLSSRSSLVVVDLAWNCWIESLRTQAWTAVKQFFTNNLTTIMRLDSTSSRTAWLPQHNIIQATLHPAKQRCIVLQCLASSFYFSGRGHGFQVPSDWRQSPQVRTWTCNSPKKILTCLWYKPLLTSEDNMSCHTSPRNTHTHTQKKKKNKPKSRNSFGPFPNGWILVLQYIEESCDTQLAHAKHNRQQYEHGHRP